MKAKNSFKNIDPVDVNDDNLMVSLGIRNKQVSERDPAVWTKTASEKKKLQRERNSHKEEIHFLNIPKKSIPVLSKLIVYLKKNKQFPFTTYSIKCWQHDIPDILSKYSTVSKKGTITNLVDKYVYNGKTYKANERPFWF